MTCDIPGEDLKAAAAAAPDSLQQKRKKKKKHEVTIDGARKCQRENGLRVH